MTTAPPVARSAELGGSGLAQVRRLRDERERRRRGRWLENQQGITGQNAPAKTRAAESARNGGPTRPPVMVAPIFCGPVDGSGVVGAELPKRRISLRQCRRVEKVHTYLCAKVDPIMGSLILALVSDRPANVRDAALQHLLLSKKQRDGRNGDGDGSEADAANAATITRPEEMDGVGERIGCRTCETLHTPCQKHAEPSIGSGDGGGAGRNRRDKCGQRDSGTVTDAVQRLAQRRDRVFMAREIGPLITELINRTLRYMPTDVESFLIEQLQEASTRPDNEYYKNGSRISQNTRASLRDDDSEEMPRSDSGSTTVAYKRPCSPRRVKPRPSTARSRLQQAQDIDFAVQKNSPPSVDQAKHRSPSPPRRPRDDLSDGPGDRFMAKGVKESKNKPWDMEVASKASLPPSHAEALPSGTDATLKTNPRLAVVLLLGIDGAGKTTLLGTLQGEHDPRVRPSVGFKPVTMMLSDQLKVKFYDLGGGKKIRTIWDNYYHDAHGLIYVVDGADTARWAESKEQFLLATGHKYLRDKPIAVILNKEDAGVRLTPEEVAGELGLLEETNGKVWCCSANSSRAAGGVPDARLEGAVEWLLENIQTSFSALNERVERDLKDMEKEFQREKERKQLAVLRGLLRKAFPEDQGTEREDCFDEREGLEFLAAEVGLEEGMLPAEGVEIAGLVGHQKLALQMVGNMKSPISRKNRARSWQEIRQLIFDLRQDIGID